ncbi:tetratricopeptide repeat (TPR)-like superfamily protein [Artemisia annua]|uniref:Tetratricopeptide repeat (TPR)-like superfamily protein n=1 Tax=Artemisia annua TaxID=35608 RepID=A0A2U1PBE5_ARTAN|nr:tetratricopeptide repeat (TPR)-like superfamily protein [Artemisia annua]
MGFTSCVFGEQDLKNLHAPDETITLFNDYITTTTFQHDYPSYSSLIYKLARNHHFTAVDTLLHHLKHYNVKPKEPLFIGLIQHYGKHGFVEKALELYRKIPEFECHRSLQSFNTLLNVLVENERFGDAVEVFEGRKKRNVVSYNVMVKMWLRKGDWESARKVFDEMVVCGVGPSVVSFNSLIGFWSKRGGFSEAKEVFDEMVGRGVKANAVTYGLLMEALCVDGRFNEAKKLMFDMEYRGCKPRLVNYGVLVNDLARRGEFDEAKGLFLEMKKRRIRPDVVMYNILVNYLCKDGRVGEAYKILVEMQVNGFDPNAATYRMIVDGFCRNGEFDEGLKVLNVMLTSRHCARLETFCCLVIGLVNNGKIDDAWYVMKEMLRRRMSPDMGCWEALVGRSCGGESSGHSLLMELVAPSG